MERFVWVCLGGAAGSGARYLLSLWTVERFGTRFPWGTLTVNVIGSFSIGALMQVSAASELLSPTLRIALVTGVLGGFTTYSAFNQETLARVQQGEWPSAVAYVAITLSLCLAAGWAGHVLAQRWLGA